MTLLCRTYYPELRYIIIVFGCKPILILLQISFVKSENHYKKRKIICIIRNSVDFCMIYSDSFHLYHAYHYILLKEKQMCLLIIFGVDL